MTFFYDLNKKLDSIRATPSTTHGQLNERSTGGYSAKDAAAGKDIGKPGKNFEKIAKGAAERYGSKERGEKVAGAVLNKLRSKTEEGMHTQHAMDLNPDMAPPPKQGILGKIGSGLKKVADVLAPGDEELLRRLEKSSGGRRPPMAKEAMSPAKQKSFAALAPPTDKITFADKIAGAKKEVDEMLGDVAAEAMKAALGKQQVRGMGEATKEIPGGRRHTAEPGGYGRKDDEDEKGKKVTVQTQRGRGRPKKNADSDTGEVMKPDFSAFGVGGKVNLPKHKGAVTRHKMSDKEPGKKVKEGADDGQTQQIYDELADIRAVAKQAQRGGEFPQGFASRLESVLYAAMTLIKNQQAGNAQVSEEELDEKATSKKQQRFMGMVHAAQKGEKPASKEVAKVAKEMPKKAAKDFAATKHKGLPEKTEESDSPINISKKVSKRSAKPEEKVDETTVSGSVASAPAEGGKKSKGGFNFGGGIYDSMNRSLESMISESMSRLDESMSINMSMNSAAQNGQGKSLTVTATDDDADKLAQMLKMAGMGNDHDHGQAYSQEPDMVDENKPDWPTNTETSDDALQYSGGLNKPKSTGQTTVPVIASQEERQYTAEGQGPSDAERLDHYHDLKASGMDPDAAEEEAFGTDEWYNDMNEQDPIARMMEMAGHPMTNRSQLDEGVMDIVKSLVPKAMKLLGGDTVADIANKVKQVTGGDYTPNEENATKVAQAFGFDKMIGSQQGQVAEGLAGNWQGKLLQLLHLVGIGAGAAAASRMVPMVGDALVARPLMAIGFMLLMVSATFWSSDKGMVGAMGRHGNTGTETGKGPSGSLDEQDAIARMMEMAGVKKKPVEEEKTEEGNLFTKGLEDNNVKVGDKIPGTNAIKKKDIDESIFAMTANLWKTYKGQ